MRILIVGSDGNMGRRYTAICKHLGCEVIFCDIGTTIEEALAQRPVKAIIASPTKMHFEHAYQMIEEEIPVLIEKPVCKRSDQIRILMAHAAHWETDVRMVCNWPYALKGRTARPKKELGKHDIRYNCYNTGKDGVSWDCIQLVGMARSGDSLHIHTDSPTFTAIFGIDTCVSLTDIDMSYVHMVGDWLYHPEHLWDLDDALWMTQRIEQVLKQ